MIQLIIKRILIKIEEVTMVSLSSANFKNNLIVRLAIFPTFVLALYTINSLFAKKLDQADKQNDKKASDDILRKITMGTLSLTLISLPFVNGALNVTAELIHGRRRDLASMSITQLLFEVPKFF